jgi:3',5'-cyclic-nucleotide phosphodiesterase
MQPAVLRVAIHTQGESPKVLEFRYDRRVTFGRADENDVVLPPNYVSRSHGAFTFDNGVWWVEDRGSLTGLMLVRSGGERVQIPSGGREPLHEGDTIEILHTLLRVEAKPIEELVALDEDWWDAAGTVSGITSTRLSSVDHLREELRSDDRRLDQLFSLATDLNNFQDTRTVLHRIASAVFEMLPHASHFSICVPAAGGEYVPHFGAVRGGQEIPVDRIEVSRSILGWVAVRQVAMLFQPGDDASHGSESIVSTGITSSMAIPLDSPRGPVGVMQVDNRTTDHAFTQPDLNLMVVLAGSAASALERAQVEAEIRRMFDGFVGASVTAIESRDPTTSGHSRRVADYSVALAEAVNRTRTGPLAEHEFSASQLTELSYAALLHDFGKVGVSECVLLKANRLHPEQAAAIESRFREMRAAHRSALLCEAIGRFPRDPDAALTYVDQRMAEISRELEDSLELVNRINRRGAHGDAELEALRALASRWFIDEDGQRRDLIQAEELASLCIGYGTLTPAERSQIESHVIESYRFLEQIPWSSELAGVPRIVLAHHERFDGTGYPYRLSGEALPARSRLLSVCDIFDAVTASDRPYRQALSHERGMEILREEARGGGLDPPLVELFVESRVWER